MKAVDTNVLIRYLVQDDANQGKKAATYIEAAAAAADSILLSNVVLCETVWVLDSAYGYSRSEIGDALDQILQSSTFQFETKDVVRFALEQFRNGKGDFADYLIGQVHRTYGCEPTATFDTALRGIAEFQIL